MSNLSDLNNHLSALQSSNQIVKTAGILSGIKGWIKKLLSNEDDYLKFIDNFADESEDVLEIIKKLYKTIIDFQNAVKSQNLSEYQLKLQEIILLSEDLSQLTKQTEHKAKIVNKLVEIKKHYSRDELKSNKENLLEQLKSQLPENHDVPFSENIKKEVSSFQWFNNFTQDNIEFGPNNKKLFYEKLVNTLISETTKSKDEIIETLKNNSNEIENNFKNAILNGLLLSYQPATPSTKIKNRPSNQNIATIRTIPFLIPEININVEISVSLLDMLASLHPSKQLKIYYLSYFRIISKTANLNFQIKKIASTVSELQLAEILRKGYNKIFGKDPSLETLGVGWAQAIQEHCHGVLLPHNNIGNITADNQWIKSGGKYFEIPITNKNPEYDSDGKPINIQSIKFKTFNSPEEGAEYYWKFLQNQYPDVIKWMDSGSAFDTAIKLGTKGYFTGQIPIYAKNMDSLFKTFITNIAPKLSEIKSNPQPPPEKPLELRKFRKDPIIIQRPETFSDSYLQKNMPKNDNAENLGNYLLSAAEYMPLTNFIKCAIYKPIFFSIESNSLHTDELLKSAKIHISNTLKNILENILKLGTVEIHENKNNIYIKIFAENSETNKSLIYNTFNFIAEKIANKTQKQGSISLSLFENIDSNCYQITKSSDNLFYFFLKANK
jgi:hypothetical protein